MSTLSEFEAFPKIPRLRRECCITEKIDGTNAQVVIDGDGNVRAGSRNRWVTPEADNYGFARWVYDNAEQLKAELGVGRHFGEWWGAGINRRYGLSEKRFSLFNSDRWKPENLKLCSVVPVIYNGVFSDAAVAEALQRLREGGSIAAPGWMQPEGVVVYMRASGTRHKVLLENDELPKGKVTYAESQVVDRR